MSEGERTMTRIRRYPLAVLRHHVTGAIERGETEAIIGKPAKLINLWRDIIPEGFVLEQSVQFTSEYIAWERKANRVEHYNPRHLPVPVTESTYWHWYSNHDAWWTDCPWREPPCYSDT